MELRPALLCQFRRSMDFVVTDFSPGAFWLSITGIIIATRRVRIAMSSLEVDR
jgi:hypothetical protein